MGLVNTVMRTRRRAAAVGATVLVLLLAVVVLLANPPSADAEGTGSAAAAEHRRPSDDRGPAARATEDTSPGEGRDAEHDGGASPDRERGPQRPPQSGEKKPPPAGPGRGDGESGRSLSQAAGRAPAPDTGAGTPGRVDPAAGLAAAAGRDAAEKAPGQARRSAPADRTQGLDARRAVTPEEVLGDQDAAPGGCVPEYGQDGQCLPSVPPSLAKHVADMRAAGMDPASMDHHWGCDEVRAHFPEGLAVRSPGVDPQGLDPNGDGLACGAGE